MKHFDLEIYLFLDNEIEQTERTELYKHLSECTQCSELFTDALANKEKVRAYYSSLQPDDLNSALNNASQDKLPANFRLLSGFKYSAAAIFILLFAVIAQQFIIHSQKTELLSLRDTPSMEKPNTTQQAMKNDNAKLATPKKTIIRNNMKKHRNFHSEQIVQTSVENKYSLEFKKHSTCFD